MNEYAIEIKSKVYANEAKKALQLANLFKKIGKNSFYIYYLNMYKSKKEFSINLKKGLTK